MHPNEEKSLIWQQPKTFEVAMEGDFLEMQRALGSDRVRFFDPMQYAVAELYDIAYPQEKDLPEEDKSNFTSFKLQYEWPHGTFVYFPWDDLVVRFPKKEDLRALRTSRNRNLINAEEQLRLYDATIFVAGLSVGSSIVEALVSMGIGKKFIVADMDIIEPSNLNRIKAPYHDVGKHKADAAAMRMSQIDPYLEWKLYREGLNENNMQEIFDLHKPDIVIDEMDQLPLKIKMRQEARTRKIPVLSAADDGDSALLDIERFDNDDALPIYHGLIPDEIISFILSDKPIPRQQLGMLIGKYFVGSEHIPLRMFESLTEVGKSLPSWPQLGGAATQSGLAVAYAARRILLKQPLRSGRFVIGPDQVLNPELDDPRHKEQLKQFSDHLDQAGAS